MIKLRLSRGFGGTGWFCYPATVIALILFGVTGNASEDQQGQPADYLSGFRLEYLAEIGRFHERAAAMVNQIPEQQLHSRCGDQSPSHAEQISGLLATGYSTLQSLDRELKIQPEELKKITDKKRLLTLLDHFADAVRRAVIETADADLNLPIDYLGRRWSVRSIFLLLYGQLQEGLGQISSASRCNGIDPPWVQQQRALEATDD